MKEKHPPTIKIQPLVVVVVVGVSLQTAREIEEDGGFDKKRGRDERPPEFTPKPPQPKAPHLDSQGFFVSPGPASTIFFPYLHKPSSPFFLSTLRVCSPFDRGEKKWPGFTARGKVLTLPFPPTDCGHALSLSALILSAQFDL